MRITRKILEAKVETFNSMLTPDPGLTLQRGFQCWNLIAIDTHTKSQRSSVLTVYGLSGWEAAHYIDGLIHAIAYLKRTPTTIKFE